MEVSISVAAELNSEEITNEADLETGHRSEEMTEEVLTNEADLETGHILEEEMEIIACLSSFHRGGAIRPLLLRHRHQNLWTT
ncbi:hypothetical protein M0R45_020438 [Rubus argutus]|uniref:Uncharacterized protein n=1 Tax=Rubus argutus TaxID=59490 RepID=A0AAW1XA04_RUBAR